MLKRKDSSFQNIESLIAHGVFIKGNINAEGSIRVDGSIDGTLDIKGDLIIGDKGYIKGEIECENLMLAGKVDGSIQARQRCLINETGVLVGDVACTVLSIEEGGTLHGASKMQRREINESQVPGKKENPKLSRILGKSAESSDQ